MTKDWVLPLLLLAAAGCGPSLARLRAGVEASPRRAVLLLPFAAPEGEPEAGPLATGLMARELADLGFTVSVATPPASGEDPGGAARAAGARGILSGKVLELSERMVTHPPEYEERVREFTDASGNKQRFVDRIEKNPPRVALVWHFRVEAALRDAESGALLWEDSTWVSRERASAESVVRAGLDILARGLARALTRPPRARPVP